MVAANQEGESATPYTALPSQSNTADDSGSDSGAARKQILSACIAVFLVQYSQSQAMIAPLVSARSMPNRDSFVPILTIRRSARQSFFRS